jgi:hypothetical protein
MIRACRRPAREHRDPWAFHPGGRTCPRSACLMCWTSCPFERATCCSNRARDVPPNCVFSGQDASRSRSVAGVVGIVERPFDRMRYLERLMELLCAQAFALVPCIRIFRRASSSLSRCPALPPTALTPPHARPVLAGGLASVARTGPHRCARDSGPSACEPRRTPLAREAPGHHAGNHANMGRCLRRCEEHGKGRREPPCSKSHSEEHPPATTETRHQGHSPSAAIAVEPAGDPTYHEHENGREAEGRGCAMGRCRPLPRDRPDRGVQASASYHHCPAETDASQRPALPWPSLVPGAQPCWGYDRHQHSDYEPVGVEPRGDNGDLDRRAAGHEPGEQAFGA